MKTSLIALFAFLSMTAGAHASTDCEDITASIQQFQNEYNQALFIRANAASICEGDQDEQACRAEMSKHFDVASSYLTEAKIAFQRAGCGDPDSTGK